MLPLPTSSSSADIERLAYKPADAARAIGVSRSMLYELIAEGLIPALKLHRRTLIRREALVAYLDTLDQVDRAA